MKVFNPTGLIATPLFLPDRNGIETLLVVIKGTWRINEDLTLSLADEQVPAHFDPIYHGAPGVSSLIHDTDIVLEKPGTDCILLGHAWSPKGMVTSLDVSFSVGAIRKVVRVFGERIWMKWLWTISISRPVPFDSIPMLWERSFGGTDTSWPDATMHETSLENPVGRGLIARKSKLEVDGLRLPNLEDPACLIRTPTDHPQPAGFTPVAPHWQPRARFAGTYDENWRKRKSPLPPDDLDPRFYSSAAPGLTTASHLKGDEAVVVDNASQRGRLAFPLPGVKPLVTAHLGHTEEELPVALDTVCVEPDQDRVVLTWRGTLAVHRRTHEFARISIRLLQL